MIQHTLDWHKGEIFESKLVLGYGLILLIISLLLNYFGNTPGAKALIFPVIIVGVFFLIVGIRGVYSNNKKLSQVEQIYQLDQKAFADTEIKRVEGFQYLYPMSLAISLGCYLIAVSFLYFSKSTHWQAIAIALILFGSAFAVIDYFSKERATIYYDKLISKINVGS